MSEPLRAGRRAWRRLGRWLGRCLLARRSTARLRRFLAQRESALRGAFYVVATPDSWGLLRPCLQLAREAVPLCVIGNGAGGEARRGLAAAFDEVHRFDLDVLPGSFWAHGTVLTLLTRSVREPFGILDPDCFVFDGGLFADLRCGERELALGVAAPGFSTWNEPARLRLPRTHWLFLNAPLLRDLMARHRIGCEKVTRTPRRLRALLASVGLGDHNFPPARLRFYDTLQLLLATGLAEGCAVRYLPVAGGGIVHFGAATRAARERH